MTHQVSRTERLARLLTRSGLDRLARMSWRGLLILNYHRIGVPGELDDPDLFSATPEDFEAQVRLLADRFEIVPAGTADLDAETPARRIAITVDDGYRDMTVAAEILSAHGVPGSFFICTGFIDEPHHAWWDEIAWLTAQPIARDLPASEWLPHGLPVHGRGPAEVRRALTAAYKQRAGERGEDFLDWLARCVGRARPDAERATEQWLTWEAVRSLERAGMEIGGHSVTHPVLANLNPQQQHREIGESVRRLRDELAGPVDTFAYPVGSRAAFDRHTKDALADLGIRRAFSFCGGVNRARRSERYDVRRAGVFRDHSPAVVGAIAAVPGVLASPRQYA
ncbi:polysaccharide deacetylase family protein [Pseudonocardia nigra]|uniref:polysaccharide deacetylase family protein n=1 Tax=Pseudonocardia nigra TaxID=1921578 RepID=UPI001C5DFE1B|nr:polysaccharide deacetylase family protein [Pseudonocardia nigra]